MPEPSAPRAERVAQSVELVAAWHGQLPLELLPVALGESFSSEQVGGMWGLEHSCTEKVLEVKHEISGGTLSAGVLYFFF